MAIDKAVDSSQLDADLTSVANAIRTKGGTSAALAFPAGFVSAIGDIPTGGGDSPLYELTFPRTQYTNVSWKYEIRKGHVKLTRITGQQSSGSYNLTDLSQIGPNFCEEWFVIPIGTAVLKIKNVINESNILWDTNFKLTGSTTYSTFNAGTSTHTSGEAITVTVDSPISVGCYYVYLSGTPAIGSVLEFDVEFVVNDIRYF